MKAESDLWLQMKRANTIDADQRPEWLELVRRALKGCGTRV